VNYFCPPLMKFIFSLAALSLILAATVFIPDFSSAQSDGGLNQKADARLKRVYQEFNKSKPQSEAELTEARRAERKTLRESVRLEERNGSVSVGVIVTLRDGSEEALAAAQTQLEQAGFKVRTRSLNLVVLSVSVDELPRLADETVIERISAARYSKPLKAEIVTPKKLRRPLLKNDQANIAVQAPNARLTYNVSGRGVVVAVIDGGIDWRHGDFKKSNGNTRIKAMWDLSDPANTGPGGVGKTFTETDINNALAGNGTVGEKDTGNHGTHVTGTAAGNGTLNGTTLGTHAGIAPEADLIIVKANRAGSEGFGEDDQVASLVWIRDQAKALNAPFVINMSLGGHLSQHDGTDAVEKTIDTLLGDNLTTAGLKGRQVVIAAGNEGASLIHAGRHFEQGVAGSWTFQMSEGAKGLFIAQAAADSFDYTITKPGGGTLQLPSTANSASDTDVEIEAENSATGNGARNIVVVFKNKTEGNWMLTARGTRVINGRLDVWDLSDGSSPFISDSADSLMHIGSPATSREGIAVASFVTKTSFTSQSGTTTKSDEGTVGAASNSSSQGPTRDGRLKPEISAPGAYVISTLSADTMPAPPAADVSPDGKHIAYTGTSMATPVTTGVIALMLEVNPDLSPGTIKRLLRRTVTNDAATGASISYKTGYGKINALEAVKAVSDNVYAREFVSVNGASYAPDTVAAPDTILSGFGSNLTTATVTATLGQPLPTTLNNVQVRVTGKTSAAQFAQLFFVSPNQINYLLPAGTSEGVALIEVLRLGIVVGRGSVSVTNAWPGLFSNLANGSGQGVGNVLRFKPGSSTPLNESVLTPIDLGIQGDRVFMELYGTGLRNKTGPTTPPTSVKAYLGGTQLNVTYAGAQSSFFGLDQINVELPSSLAGRNASLNLVVYVDGRVANTITFPVK
jgi:uncharacterized protein (TIGR03437 family)